MLAVCSSPSAVANDASLLSRLSTSLCSSELFPTSASLIFSSLSLLLSSLASRSTGPTDTRTGSLLVSTSGDGSCIMLLTTSSDSPSIVSSSTSPRTSSLVTQGTILMSSLTSWLETSPVPLVAVAILLKKQ